MSAAGARLGSIALVGTVLAARPSLGWVDPVGSLAIALAATTAGVATLRREETELQPYPDAR